MELTAPFDVSVVAVAKRAELTIPKRTSFPSMLHRSCAAARRSIDAQRGR